MISFKRHYATCYWHLRKNFLDDLEDSMSQDSLLGSTISNRSQKNISCASRISSPNQAVSHKTPRPQRCQRSPMHMISIPRILIMHYFNKTRF